MDHKDLVDFLIKWKKSDAETIRVQVGYTAMQIKVIFDYKTKNQEWFHETLSINK